MVNRDFSIGLTFDDVLLEPQKTTVKRDVIEVSTRITKKIKLRIPILSSAMDTVSETEMAVALGKLGGMTVLHRNCSQEKEVAMVKKTKQHQVLVGAAVGPHDIVRAKALDKAGADVLFIDCAHAYNGCVIQDAKKIKKVVRVPLVVGNIATKEAALELIKFADALKVGVGPGSICTTRVVCGIGVPQLTAILNVVAVAKKRKIPVIADGGMKYSGDVVKALAAGASAVMIGSLLAGTKEAPGKVIRVSGQLVKAYRGMGSLGAMEQNQSSDRYFQKGSKKYVPEGIEGVVPYKGPVKEVIWQLVGGLRSGLGYIGAKSIAQMTSKARFIRITRAGLAESHPHTVAINKKAPNY